MQRFGSQRVFCIISNFIFSTTENNIHGCRCNANFSFDAFKKMMKRKLSLFSNIYKKYRYFPNEVFEKNYNSNKSVSEKSQIVNAAEKIVQEKWEIKMKLWMRKYEDLFGITQLSELHTKVLNVQEKIQSVQEKRRIVQEEIFAVQKKLQESQDILHKTSLGDDMYISLVTQVRDLLKAQRQLQEVFSLHDKTERELQMTLALAINSSQDHERTYREKNKYLSLISGVVGAILGLFGSTINNWRHRKDIKVFASDIANQVSELQKQIDNRLINLPVPKVSSNDNEKPEIVLNELKMQQETIYENLKHFESVLNNKALINYEKHDEVFLDLQLKQMIHNLEENFDAKLKLNTSINVGLLTSLLLLTGFLFYIGNIH